VTPTAVSAHRSGLLLALLACAACCASASCALDFDAAFSGTSPAPPTDRLDASSPAGGSAGSPADGASAEADRATGGAAGADAADAPEAEIGDAAAEQAQADSQPDGGGLDTGADLDGGGAGDSKDTGAESGPDVLPAEDCLNGNDDDGDGKTDCQDPDCTQGHACVPAPAAGWSAPAFVKDRSPFAPPASCGPAFVASTYYAGLTANQAQCACACGAPSGASCQDAYVRMFLLAGCGNAIGNMHVGCESFGGGAQSVQAVRGYSLGLDKPGSCAPSVTTSLPPATWKSAFDLCGAPGAGAGCPNGEVCVPRPPPGFSAAVCVQRNGESACTSKGYPLKTTVGTGALADSRACIGDDCSCTTPVGGSCAATVTLYSATACSGSVVASIPANGSCTPTGHSSDPAASARLDVSVNGGTCWATGTGTPVGTATWAETHTLCCAIGPW
jgi:hypothetical protein